MAGWVEGCKTVVVQSFRFKPPSNIVIVCYSYIGGSIVIVSW